MHHRLVSLGLLAVLSTLACDTAEESRCDVVVASFRSLMPNGANLNGASLNGMSFNGTNLNGDDIHENQGTNLNGQGAQGIGLQGVALNGANLNGANLNGLDLVGTALRATDAEGRTIEGTDLIGARLLGRAANQEIELRIASVEVADDLTWYGLTHEGQSICGDDNRGLFVRGVWDETGARRDAVADDPAIAFTFSCAAGVIAKCVAWGYTPDDVGVDAHQTCTRLARADYCGDGQPHTADGTLVDVFDTLGVMQPDPSVDLAFEAGWGPRGATCVSRPRYEELDASGREVEIPCWDALPACDDADAAIATGATLLNRSAPQTLCYAE
jgi:hypothetical protein